MLDNSILDNLAMYRNLIIKMKNRTGFDSVSALKKHDFAMFFKLALPKVLTKLVMEEDWYIDANRGILIFEFQREAKGGPYKMLHLVMDIIRKNPPREQRAPGTDADVAIEAYHQIIEKIFTDSEIIITKETINEELLKESLINILGRRKKYYPEDTGIESLDK